MAGNKVKDRRLVVMAVILVLGLVVVAGKLALIQGIQAEHYKELASDQRDTHIQITPSRGTLFDREGEILAISEDVTTVYATPYQVKNPEAAALDIAEVLGEDPEDVQDKLDSNSGFVYLARKLDKTLANRIKELDIEGVGFVDESKRFYPMGEFASQVLGIVDVDNEGQAGLELYYDDTLGGNPGEILLERDAVGNPIPGSEKRRVQAVDGVDLQLTIDKDIQACVEESLSAAVDRFGARAGTAVVLDCNSGEILAMATSPSFDPNDRSIVEPEAMRNRAVTDVYEPGSVLKVVTAAGALEEGVVDPNSVIQVSSQLQVADEVFTDAETMPSRALEFNKVISQSSNVGTIQVALMLGNNRLSEYLDRFGLGHLTGVDFPGEVGGLVPAVSDWSGTSIATISIGQGISVTPLQLVCVAGMVANGGHRICPHFLKAKITDKGVEDMGLGGIGRELLTEETCREMIAIMEQVVAPGGTGTRAAVNYYRVAGKTGTAAKPRENAAGYSKRYMASFIGFAPAENPRLAVVVVMDEPSPIWGGHTSAPVFKEIMGYSLQHLNIPTSWGTPPPG
ncbi:MAG: penicillin-binding protein 2 [Actinobacteria bacterium]|nr:penicillin-binding protein 2 [Actinomycetota bacterium]MCG2818478.1 penicillin-binding protein 2 [Actinomycetes bacterium]MBU4219426.1 penicillin-binding protein 2 [Actinomycetota bacterium]MBU4358170.1 penicillin-binding protein 2 [Actinomycetota bacterium]MBU4392231.1 penicillin-binding protein 2 [Actinomycetota bacterium]